MVQEANCLLVQEQAVQELKEKIVLQAERIIGEYDGAQRRPIAKALKLLRVGKVPESCGHHELDKELQKLDRAVLGLSDLSKRYEEHYDNSALTLRKTILGMTENNAFREALTWQNLEALHGSIEALQKMPLHNNSSDSRRREAVVVSYIQRYSTKNSSIGFFGPVGWGYLRDKEMHLDLHSGGALVKNTRVYFEHWAIQLIADKLSEDSKVKEFIPLKNPSSSTYSFPQSLF
ncbi:MAG: lantibiotic dehydratase [Myxococcales bacterium]|nr:MAG: lantibiotic dehydratase [Myxococcales bacterium]